MIATVGSAAQVDYLVPDRFKLGYGLSRGVVDLAVQHPRLGKPDLIVTVDNGIASVDGVQAANDAGIRVLVTDHHLPGESLPDALIVNPNQPGCAFPSKNLAGVGVMFYVLLALRAELRKREAFKSKESALVDLLDIVALGTVADVVPLDRNNRILVAHGLKRIRSGKASAGVSALFHASGRAFGTATATDLGFSVGPRINAAGRLEDMSIGIECLISDDPLRAGELAAQLDALNRSRREIEAQMRGEADAFVESSVSDDAYSICLYDDSWHQGVVGLVASRLKEKHNRPVIAFAPGGDGLAKGSGRSVPALHMRDCLDLISKRYPNLIQRFGGHAMAAGLTIAAADVEVFRDAFEAACKSLLRRDDLAFEVQTDGFLPFDQATVPFVESVASQVWGQGFPAPLYSGVFEVSRQSLVKDKHVRMTLSRDGVSVDAIQFNSTEFLPDRALVAYRLEVDVFQGLSRVSYLVQGWSPAPAV
jgi:single-stranded-DNA-specific exonuclease